MKKRRIITRLFVIVVLIGLISGAIYYQLELLAKDDQVELKTVSLTGQIINIDDNNVVIRDNQNTTYTIDRQMIKDDLELIFSNQLTISYTGDLNGEYEIKKSKIKTTPIINGILTDDEYQNVITTVQNMSLEDKVGQLLLVLHTSNLSTNQTYAGCVLYDENFKNKSRNEVMMDIKEYQDSAKYPMIIAVDEEGGSVVRVSKYLRNNRFRLASEVYRYGGMDAIVSDATEKSEYLKEFGINVNLAPVADVAINKEDYMYQRCFSTDATMTSNYVSKVVQAMNDVKMGSVLKHFPGYGSGTGGNELYHDSRDYKEFEDNDLLSFKAGIEAKANGILVTNNIIDCLDSQNPATLSIKVHQLLRDELNYQGVILSDDIDTLKDKEFGSESELAVKALKAGNDLIMTSSPQVYFEAILNAINNNEISENSLDLSVLRVIAWKQSLGII